MRLRLKQLLFSTCPRAQVVDLLELRHSNYETSNRFWPSAVFEELGQHEDVSAAIRHRGCHSECKSSDLSDVFRKRIENLTWKLDLLKNAEVAEQTHDRDRAGVSASRTVLPDGCSLASASLSCTMQLLASQGVRPQRRGGPVGSESNSLVGGK